jgi:hypothetical protein
MLTWSAAARLVALTRRTLSMRGRVVNQPDVPLRRRFADASVDRTRHRSWDLSITGREGLPAAARAANSSEPGALPMWPLPGDERSCEYPENGA